MISTFSEKMDPATINGPTVFLKKGGTTVPAVVTYNPNSRQAILNPSRNLAAGASYIATVTMDVKDLAGNSLSQGESWSFKIKKRR